MTPQEFNLALTGYFEGLSEEREASFKQRLEVERFGQWMHYNTQVKSHQRLKEPSDLIPFPWEQQKAGTMGSISESERKRLNNIVDQL